MDEQQLNDELIKMNIHQKKRDCFNAAKQRAIDKLVEKYYTQAFQLQLKRGACQDPYLNEAYNFYKEEQIIEDKRQEELIEEKGYKDKTEYTFITINPKPELCISPIEMKNHMDKIVEKTKWINENDYAYVVEQRSNTPSEYSGVHSHLLVHTGDKPLNEIRRELKSKVKNLCDMEVVKKFDKGKNRKGPLSIEPTYDPTNRLSYMLDWKKDKDKHIKQIIDKEMREKYNLEKVYYTGEKLSHLILEQLSSQNQTCQTWEEDNAPQSPNVEHINVDIPENLYSNE